MTQITKNLLTRIASGFNRDRDHEEPMALVVDIQQALDCSYGLALCYANDIRIGKIKGDDREDRR